MKYDFTQFKIIATGNTATKAATVFAEEIMLRSGYTPEVCEQRDDNFVYLKIKNHSNAEDYTIEHDGNKITITAHRLRGLIYGFGEFLKKAIFADGKIFLCQNISGKREPSMKIRGHQLSYTDMNNTLDTWSPADYERYILDLMFFGLNTVEADSGVREEHSYLMKHTQKEILIAMSKICVKFDIELSVWHELWRKDSDEETLAKMHTLYDDLPKLDIIFPPGGDPGDMQGDEFVKRCIKIKQEMRKVFPDIQVWPSAQAPHEYADWGEKFLAEMAKLPDEIDGIIYGPNHAFPLDEMRRKIHKKYPFRLYPDIGHNVRCETPVHFDVDDWHYALAATLSREAVNPRADEYRHYHRITRQYVDGSVTYSEGVNDDLNKFVWSALDFDFNADLREIVCDYCRAFYPETDAENLADLLLSFEKNWYGDPAENDGIDKTFDAFVSLSESAPSLMRNWRFVLHLFRAYCDKIVRDRRNFELALIKEAKVLVYKNEVAQALEILKTDFSESYKQNRQKLDELAEILFELIGIQLSVERYHGMNWERGCTLDTIDNPVSDRAYLVNKLTEKPEKAVAFFERNNVEKDEYYFSFAQHGFEVCGKQTGEFYMNFQGDSNKSSALPMCMTKVYDHFNFSTTVAGLTGGDYKLRITYKNRKNDEIEHHKITINGNVLHDGKQFGGEVDEEFTALHLADGYVSVAYDVPEKYLINGCATLEITEPLDGFMISEFWFVKA